MFGRPTRMSVKMKQAVGHADLRRLDEVKVRYAHRVQRAFKFLIPKIKELLELGKTGREVIVLPHKRLQPPWMIGCAVQNLCGRESEALELTLKIFANHLEPPFFNDQRTKASSSKRAFVGQVKH